MKNSYEKQARGNRTRYGRPTCRNCQEKEVQYPGTDYFCPRCTDNGPFATQFLQAFKTHIDERKEEK